MSTPIDRQVKFDFIRYANCWEDAEVLLEGLQVQPGARIVSVASAGDNTFSLLTTNPALVVAVDINPAQLYLVELKKVAFQTLAYHELLQFLGVQQGINRLQVYQQLRPNLDKPAQQFWDNRSHLIESGVIYAGKFERYFKFFRKWVLPFIHSRQTNLLLFQAKAADEQNRFYHNKWNNIRWRLFFRAFFSEWVLGRFGRDPRFLKEVEIPVASFIFNQAAQHLQTEAAQQNYFLRFIHLGHFGSTLPHYLQPQHFNTIRQNLSNLQLVHGYVQQTFTSPGYFDYFNLSNIFEYMPQNEFQKIASNIAEAAAPGARLAYWNLMVPRRLSLLKEQSFLYDEPASQKLTRLDKGFFYKEFIADVKQ